MPEKGYRGVWIELEACIECETHQYCTRHQSDKYERYEKDIRSALEQKVRDHPIVFERNVGPDKAQGMNCRRIDYNKFMWTTMRMNPDTRKWYPETTFRYPRLGGFEVTVCKMKQRVEAFSKLKLMKWPNPQWLAERINDIVNKQLGGWEEEEAPVDEAPKKRYTGVGGKQSVTDDELRKLIKDKFKTIISAFRSFDKNGDGQVNKREFMTGMRGAGVDLPPEMMDRLWKLADEDNSGTIQYQEFARKFCSFKASASLHRHGSMTAADAKVAAVHGSGGVTRTQKHASIRESEELTFKLDEHEFTTEKKDDAPKTMKKLAQDPNLKNIPVEQLTPDQVRARIYQKHGNLLNAFRHFDLSGDSRIAYDEFLHHMPKVFGEPISMEKCKEVWASMDTDLTGEIDIEEFASERLVSKSAQGAKMFKGMAIGFGEMADHQKHTTSFISQDKIQADMKDGVIGDGADHKGGLLDEQLEQQMRQDLRAQQQMSRPVSQSTIASESDLQGTGSKGLGQSRPQSAANSQKSLPAVQETQGQLPSSSDEYSWDEQ